MFNSNKIVKGNLQLGCFFFVIYLCIPKKKPTYTIVLKKIAVIILFIAFAFRPVYHMGYLVYFQLNIDYIIETYCVNKKAPELKCNGKCHLAKQLQVDVPSSNLSNATLAVVESFFPVFYKTLAPVNFKTNYFSQKNKISIHIINHYKSLNFYKGLKPPIA